MGRESKSESINQWLEGVHDAHNVTRRNSPSNPDEVFPNGVKRKMPRDRPGVASSPRPSFLPDNSSHQHNFRPPLNMENTRQLRERKTKSQPSRAEQTARRTSGKKQKPNATPGTQQVQFGAETQPQTGQSKKRRRAQTEASSDDAGSGSRLGRLSSPTSAKSTPRTQLRLLEFACPSIARIPIGANPMSPFVTCLFRQFFRSLETPLPPSIVSLWRKEYPMDILSLEFDDVRDAPPTGNEEALFRTVIAAYTETNDVHLQHGDESQWSKVVSIILNRMETEGHHMLKVTSAQTVSIGPVSVMPKINGHIPFKKVDFLVSFSNAKDEIRNLTKAVLRYRRGLLLSQTEDATVGYQSHFVALEAKSLDGSYNSSSLQLATWLTAGLEKISQLIELAATENLPDGLQEKSDLPSMLPFIGISVVGHTWDLHIAEKQPNGDVNLHGPLNMGNTLSLKGIFQILCVLDQVRAWGESVYWPWLRDRVLTPLAGPSAMTES